MTDSNSWDAWSLSTGVIVQPGSPLAKAVQMLRDTMTDNGRHRAFSEQEIQRLLPYRGAVERGVFNDTREVVMSTDDQDAGSGMDASA